MKEEIALTLSIKTFLHVQELKIVVCTHTDFKLQPFIQIFLISIGWLNIFTFPIHIVYSTSKEPNLFGNLVLSHSNLLAVMGYMF